MLSDSQFSHGAHLVLVPKVIDLVRANGQKDVRVFVGGIIPEEDIPVLMKSRHNRHLRSGYTDHQDSPGYTCNFRCRITRGLV